MNERGQLYLISAPSGAGKTSLVRALIASETEITVSVSHTTRTPRPGERDGFDYHFVDRPTFDILIQQGQFLEHALVFGHTYGTSRDAVLAQLDQGLDVILEIDWQGARQARMHIDDSCGIFILPPSLAALRQRLEHRAQDDPSIIERRMRAARDEMSHYDEFDYLVVNDDFDHSLAALCAIVRARRQQRIRQQQRHHTLFRALLDTQI